MRNAPKEFVGLDATGSVLVFDSATLYRLSMTEGTSVFGAFAPVSKAARLPIRPQVDVETSKLFWTGYTDPKTREVACGPMAYDVV